MLSIYYAFFMFLIVFIELVRKKTFRIDFLTFFNFNFILYYTLPSFLLSVDFNNAAINETKRVISDFQDLKTAIAILLGYIILNIGYLSKSAKGFSTSIIIERKINSRTDIIFYKCLIGLSIVSIFIYSLHYGGIIKAISLSSVIRSGLVEAGSFSFFKRFFSASKFTSFFLFSYLLYEKRKKKPTSIKIIFLISVIVTLFGFLFLASRGVYIEYILVFALILFIRNKKIKIKKIGLIAVIGVFILLYGDVIFANLRYLPEGPSCFIRGIKESFKYKSIDVYGLLGNFQLSTLSLNVALKVVKNINYSYRFFIDLIYGLFSLIPEVLTGINVPETIAYYNTYYIKGKFISNIPPGMLAYSIYSFGWFGLVMLSYFWGWIGSFLDRIISNNIDKHYWTYPLYVLIAMEWSIGSSGEPRMFFQSKIILILISIYLFFIANKCHKK